MGDWSLLQQKDREEMKLREELGTIVLHPSKHAEPAFDVCQADGRCAILTFIIRIAQMPPPISSDTECV